MRSGIYAIANSKLRQERNKAQEVIRIGNKKFNVIEKPQFSSPELGLMGMKTCFVVQPHSEDCYQIYNQLNGKLSEKLSSVKRMDMDMFFVRLNDSDRTKAIFFCDELYDYEVVKQNSTVMGDIDELVENSEYNEYNIDMPKSQRGE